MNNDFLNTLFKFWSNFPSRLNHPLNHLAWYYAVIFILGGWTFLRFKYKKNWKRELKAIVNSKEYRHEQLFDLKHYAFKMFIDPIFVFATGVSLFLVAEKFSKHLITSYAPSLNQTQFELNSASSSLIVSAVMFLVWDFSIFVSHWTVHRVPFLWHFHSYHHRSRYLNPFLIFRAHPVDLLVKSFINGFIVFLGFAVLSLFIKNAERIPIIETGLLHVVFTHVVVHFHHSPFSFNYPGFFNRLFVSPAMHHVHHSTKPEHAHRNYGRIFSFWDGMFGVRYIPKSNESFQWGEGPAKKKLFYELARPFLLNGRHLFKK